MPSSTPLSASSNRPPSRNCLSVPRAGLVNARRPGHGPGRSAAKSIDEAEHGASIIRAMVARLDQCAERGRVLQGRRACARTDCCGRQRHTSGRVHVHADGAMLPAELGMQTATRATASDGVNDPRQGTLGSGAGHGSGVVHAIVPAVTSARTSSGESAQNAASSSGARQGTPRQAVACGSRSSPTKGEREPGADGDNGGPT